MTILAFLGAAWWAILLAILVGVLAGGIAMWVMKESTENSNVGCGVTLGVGMVAFLLTFGAVAAVKSYTPIQRGTVGLVTLFGKLQPNPLQPGLNWITPFVEHVEVVDTTQQTYEMSNNPDTSQAAWRDYPANSQTSDGQQVNVTATTIFRVPDADAAVEIRQNIGPIKEVVENVVKVYTRSLSRQATTHYHAEQLYSGDRAEFQEEIRQGLEEAFAENGHGLVLVDFQVRYIEFDTDYVTAIEQQQIAQENIKTQQYNAEASVYEANKLAEMGRGEAEAAVQRAQGDAEAKRLLADAEAYRIQQEGTALRRNPEVLQLRFIENLNDKTLWLPSEGIQYLMPTP